MRMFSSHWNKRKGLICFGVVVLLVVIISTTWYVHQRNCYENRTICVSNLAHIRMAKKFCRESLNLKNGDSIEEQVLSNNLHKPLDQLKCPSGGKYIVNEIGQEPECTFTNICYTYRFDFSEFKIEKREWKHEIGVPSLKW